MDYRIYALLDPRTNHPFYVGMTTNVDRRFKQHIYGTGGDQPLKDRYVKGLRDAGLVPNVHVLDVVLVKRDALRREVWWWWILSSEGYSLVNDSSSFDQSVVNELSTGLYQMTHGMELSLRNLKKRSLV